MHRVIVTTDITSTRAGYKEPDDCQSLVRLLAMSDSYQIEGLIASSRLHHGQDAKPEHIRQIVEAYGQVRANLAKHSATYPKTRELLSCIRAGQPIALPDLPVEASIGPDTDTQASDLIIDRLKHSDPRPLWLIAWGGTADLAQALWRMRESFTASQSRRLRAKLRVYAISDQDSTSKWIRAQFPDLFYILNYRPCRGMYRWGDTSLCTPQWVEENVRQNRGPLGAAYPNYDGGDIFSSVKGVKEGDTPSMLYLFENGLNMPDRPELGGWGGRFVPSEANPRHYIDAQDEHPGAFDEMTSKAATVFRWRDAYQREFSLRMKWCVKPPRDCSHPPVVRLTGPARRRVKLGTTFTLDVSASRGADGTAVLCRWFIYPDAPGVELEFENPAETRTRATLRAGRVGQEISVVGEVSGSGEAPFVRYARILLKIAD